MGTMSAFTYAGKSSTPAESAPTPWSVMATGGLPTVRGSAILGGGPRHNRSGQGLQHPGEQADPHSSSNLISTTSYSTTFAGVVTSTKSPTLLPMRARPTGDCTEILLNFMSASSWPTSVYCFFA